MVDTRLVIVDWHDSIEIKNIQVRGKHGLTKIERDQSLPLEVSVLLNVDLSKPAKTDDISDTVNYSQLHTQIVKVVEERSHQLLERVAQDILDAIFEDLRVKAARVSISKPDRLRGATPVVTLVRWNSV